MRRNQRIENEKETNPSNMPQVHIKIEKACHEMYKIYGQFELRRGPLTAKARKVIKQLESIADKYGLKRSHLFDVYFAK